MKITGGTSGYFHHYTDIDFLKFAGLSVTFSLLESDGSYYTATGILPSSTTWLLFYITTKGGIRFEVVIGDGFGGYQANAPSGTSAMVDAVKLEFGPVSTLAHKEGDTWVLNDPPPDPALELLKCKKYLQPMMFSAWSCVDKYISTKGEFLLTFESRMFPVQMRANPIIINPDDIWISNQSYNTWYKPLSVNSFCTKYTCLLSVALEEEIYNSRDKFFLWSGKIAGVGSPILFSADL